MDLFQEETSQEDTFFCLFWSTGSNDEEKDCHEDMTIARTFHYCSKWKHDQDAVHWVKLEEAQELGLQFWQTKSNAIVVYESVVRFIFKIVAKSTRKPVYERKDRLQLALRVVLRSNLYNKQQAESSCQRKSSIQQMQSYATRSTERSGHYWNETRSQDENPEQSDLLDFTTSIFYKDRLTYRWRSCNSNLPWRKADEKQNKVDAEAGGEQSRLRGELKPRELHLPRENDQEDPRPRQCWTCRIETDYCDYPMSIMLEASSRWDDQLLLWLGCKKFLHRKMKKSWNDSEYYADDSGKVSCRQEWQILHKQAKNALRWTINNTQK